VSDQATDHAAEAETPPVLRPLVCPYCAGKITAEWGKDGAPTGPPLEHYWRIGKPDGYAPPWLVTP